MNDVGKILLRNLALLALLASWACDSYNPTPRRYAYPRIDIPAQTQYQSFRSESCPFTFEYPDFGKITRDMPDSCWVDIAFPRFDCKWHFTYHQAGTRTKTRHAYYEEYRRLVYEHSKKAKQINETAIQFAQGAGIRFDINGEVGTPQQLFLYDSTEQQILMMSFYFQTATKNDSLQPVIRYMKGEIEHMLETFRWD